MILTNGKSKFDLGGDIFDMMTNYKLNAMSIGHPEDGKHLLVFVEEMRFDVKHTGNKNTREKFAQII